MKFLIATKEHMTQVYDESGRTYPATILSVGPSAVTQIKTPERDGYAAVQVGFGEKKEKNVNKAQRALGTFAGFREWRGEPVGDVALHSTLSADVFAAGDEVTLSAVSKGKGFQGVVKRHGFKGGPRTHGQKHSEREPGSIGGGGRAGGRVVKGMRMAGRMGSDKVTLHGVKILQVDKERNVILVNGSVPGRRGTLVEIRG